ncbi:4'-phosphopantetheinyl transferase family protein [Streptomyces eurocidicus]|uniref:4'-phosphopantetheinyl transferase EntD n=1 Tax=Streptomyces eurocidicus TaxID=66423 RepID=A0A7W8BCG6_STREU|nr:4'-phosphopantetheinyl transferase superfamily protein [Streptomyces eurocidicus]MBB5119726.1 4'-phosphopantetheinyl transferase EntD [Streptomyces eurocidicus]MBF6050749.1 4'-phosphopantetheinyl transferase superfamily protein [Streptomyces eurocidicus]
MRRAPRPARSAHPARPVSGQGTVGVLRWAGADGAEDALHPAERDLLSGRSPGRRRDFTAGRYAAAEALRLLGRPGPVLRDGRRPRFPAGVRGSISHCEGAVAVCLATVREDVLGIGVDIERTGRLGTPAAGLVCTERERARLGPGPGGGARLTAVFSAKEAFYKAFSALEPARAPTFHEVEVAFLEDGRLAFETAAGLLPRGTTATGRIGTVGPYVRTSVLLRA